MDRKTLLAFGLTLFAGLATGIGSAIAFFGRRTSKRFLSALPIALPRCSVGVRSGPRQRRH